MEASSRSGRIQGYAVPVTCHDENRLDLRVGLCGHCQHMRTLRSDRGSTFYMCQLSTKDPSFPKYPRLPVLRCGGYEKPEEGPKT